MFYHPLYRARKDGRHHRKRSVLQPVLDQYRVDLVLQGHEHDYARSGLLSDAERSLPKSRSQSPAGTVYVVSVSGPKMMEVASQPIMRRIGTGYQLYQIISIDHDQLHYEARTATGALFDAFTLIKQHRETHPLSNQLIETLPTHSMP